MINKLKVGSKYTRKEIYKIVSGKDKMPFDWQQTGYGNL